MKHAHRTQTQILALVLATALLSACGIKGDLDRPPPLWGAKSDAPVVDGKASESEPLDRPGAPEELTDDEDEPGYGVDVAD